MLYLGEAHVEFCCHLARGNIDPKEPPVYEYVKFVGDFKFHNNGERRILSTQRIKVTFHDRNRTVISRSAYVLL